MIHIFKRRRRTITQLESLLKNILDEYVRTYKRKPTITELEGYLRKIDVKLAEELENATTSFLRKMYVNQRHRSSKDIGIKPEFSRQDNLAVQTLLNQPVLSRSISGLKQKTLRDIRNVFYKYYNDPKGFNLRKLQQDIKEVSNTSDFRAEMISRAEGTKISTAARRMSYLQADPTDSYKYTWVGPDDSRTTSVSQRIKSRTQKGVSWSELIQIVQEESIKMIPNWKVNNLAPLSHPFSRHFPIRKQ